MPCFVFAQKENSIWYFGDKAGVDFNQTPPKELFNSQMNTTEGCASISDQYGSLLFYTDGETVWNKNHDTMAGGRSLFGSETSVHSALIAKQPKSNRYYYIFTSDVDADAVGQSKGVNYSVVDMFADSGRGSVISANNFLYIKSSEKIAATYHKNGSDIWVAVPQSADTIFVFELTENGLRLPPAKFNTAAQGNILKKFDARSQIKFSVNGKKIAHAVRGAKFYPKQETYVKVLLFDFNNDAGVLSNKKELLYYHPTSSRVYGLEFSPNNKFLYLGMVDEGIYQCPIDGLQNSGRIDSVCIKVSNKYKSLIYSLQLAPNGKIYAAQAHQGLGVVNYPDSLGLSCGFDSLGINLKSGGVRLGLPTFLPNTNLLANNTCFGDSTEFSVITHSADSVLWLFDDGQKKMSVQRQVKHRYQNTGNYAAQAIIYLDGDADTLLQNIVITKLPNLNLGSDTVLCAGDSLNFDLQHPDINTYQWGFGDTLPNVILKTAGEYWVAISNAGCEMQDTINIQTLNSCNIKAQNLCFGDTTLLTLPNTDADSIEWYLGDGSIIVNTIDVQHRYADSGSYQVSAKQYKGRLSKTTTKTITITKVEKPFLGNDTILCKGKNIQVNASPQYDSYKWNDGGNMLSKAISKAGLYWLEVEKNNCKANDSVLVTVFDCDFAITSKCLGDTTVFQLAGQNADSIEWNFGDGVKQGTTINKSQHVYTNGTSYTVIATVYIGEQKLQLTKPIEIIQLPTISLASDTTICENQTIKSPIVDNTVNQQWNNTTQNIIKPEKDGYYFLTIEKRGCTQTDSIYITLNSCGCELFFPSAFTPNNDDFALNEEFGPVTDCVLSEYKLLIFNRWGQKVFESNTMHEGWDAVYKSSPVPIGTYTWVARYRSAYTGKLYNQKGVVTVIR